ncbi:hypothetical protein [Natronorubrum sp. FCH18a]|uniref:hypothetical protein n=1 Tax=Natronorubrum sp. FCH18a TaxID=3447018 RepID=UPI003F5179C5
MTADDLLREAERESRRELEQEARKAHELRARLPQLVENAIRKDHERIAVELAERSELTYREIGEIVDYSHVWVAQVVNEAATEDTDQWSTD